MDAFLTLSAQERRLACLQAEGQMGLQAASVEKDYWVCWTLRELFSLSGVGEHLTFKGGTSLSKVWQLIERFSEDIDLITDKSVLGFSGDASPDRARSKKQRKVRLGALMDACCHWVQGPLQPALAARSKRRWVLRSGSSKWTPTWLMGSACFSITLGYFRPPKPATCVLS